MHDLNQRQGRTFVIVTHDPAIGAQANRIVRMRDGRILDAGASFVDLPTLELAAD